MSLYIQQNDEIQTHLDKPPVIACPQCGVVCAAVPISMPRFALIQRFDLQEVGIVARCSSCNRAVFMRYKVMSRNNPVIIDERFTLVNGGLEPFEMRYLSGNVPADFNESLVCLLDDSSRNLE